MLRSSYAYVYAHQRFRCMCLCLFHRVNQALVVKRVYHDPQARVN
jgi:hypothetical protein